MQPPFSRWYNPDKRCDVMVGSSVHFNWTIARIESGSWWAKDERNLWKSLSSIILSPEHPQNDEWSELLGKTQILPEKMIQEWQWIVNHIVVQCRIFCFVITSHPWTKHVFPLSSCCFEIKRCFFQRVFLQNILIRLQHAIKINQSWRLKVFWLQKWLDA